VSLELGKLSNDSFFAVPVVSVIVHAGVTVLSCLSCLVLSGLVWLAA